ncbi:MFS transporter [Lacihabitans sp. LS3-19]|uniref:spinster family MFS transporter n=1 Tax=Lacihabitans sp. LS3-19 TaxID=2487335 RepID=UPI0020CD4AC0|nr:MFS transporter [Lacihabitans sp. LS3-19]MCP9766402.1 MFS transporter [Lacihabitans sp. LS3-19]
MKELNPNYKWKVLLLLTIVYVFNFIDRQILVILQEPIKAELSLSDTQLGLLTGLTFAAFYVILGIPIARFADRSNRKNIIVASLALWSAMTAISGMSKNFFQLLLARVGVGVGEAGGSPPAHSIISDYFPLKQRATALSIYSMGIYIGILLGFIIGGVIAKSFGWRNAFYAIGIPGLLFAIIVYFSIKEPIRGLSDAADLSSINPTLKEVLQTLMKKRTFIFVALASGFQGFSIYGIGNFMPAFLNRVHHVDIATAGIVLGLTMGIGGGIGTFLGGYLSDKNSHKDMRWHIWVPMIAGIISFPFVAITFFSNQVSFVYVGIFLTSCLTALYLGPTIAITHSLVNAKMRAFASAILFFVLNLIGLGGGPLVIGLLSDALLPRFGDLSLRWAYCGIFVSLIIALLFQYLGSKNYLKDLKNAVL